MTTEKGTIKMFDNTTPHLSSVYDEQILSTIPYYESFHQEIIHIIKMINKDPSIWLDTGAGTGTMVSRNIELFPNTLFLLADPSEEMLSEARLKLSQYGSERIQFLPPATTQSIVLDSTLKPDVITAVQSHHYLSKEERKMATKVCYKLLAEGGVFVTFENIRPLTEQGINYGKLKWADYQRSKGKSDEQVSKHIDRFDKEYFPITVEEHLQLYRECGFKVVELLWYSYMQAGFYCIK
jgi:Methylase involved in ubiquinone/menaquinone biosynthesis